MQRMCHANAECYVRELILASTTMQWGLDSLAVQRQLRRGELGKTGPKTGAALELKTQPTEAGEAAEEENSSLER